MHSMAVVKSCLAIAVLLAAQVQGSVAGVGHGAAKPVVQIEQEQCPSIIGKQCRYCSGDGPSHCCSEQCLKLPSGLCTCSSRQRLLSTVSADSILPQGKLSSIVPVFTAFAADGSTNITAVADQYAYASQNGIDVLLLMGTTGEWPTLTVDERMALADAWCAAKKKHVPRSGGTTPTLMLNIGHASPYESRRMATHAVGLAGIDSLLVSPPGLPYHAPNLDLLIDALAIALEPAPALPAFYYHYQDLYGDTFKMKDLFYAAQAGRLPTLVGAKFAGAGINLVDVMEVATLHQQPPPPPSRRPAALPLRSCSPARSPRPASRRRSTRRASATSSRPTSSPPWARCSLGRAGSSCCRGRGRWRRSSSTARPRATPRASRPPSPR